MKLSTTTFWQALTLIAGAANQYADFIPPKWKPYVTAASAIAVIILHLRAGNTNPDGTSAKVAYIKE